MIQAVIVTLIVLGTCALSYAVVDLVRYERKHRAPLVTTRSLIDTFHARGMCLDPHHVDCLTAERSLRNTQQYFISHDSL